MTLQSSALRRPSMSPPRLSAVMQSTILSNHAANVQLEGPAVAQSPRLTATCHKAFETYIDQSHFRSPEAEKQQEVDMSMTQEQLRGMTLSQRGDDPMQTPPPPKHTSLPNTGPVKESEVDNIVCEDPPSHTEEDIFMEAAREPLPCKDDTEDETGSSGESEVEGETDVDEYEQPRRSQRVRMKKMQDSQIDSEEDMDLDDAEVQVQQKELQPKKKLDNEVEMTHEDHDNSGNPISEQPHTATPSTSKSDKAAKPDTPKVHKTRRKPTSPIEISEAGSPLPNLTPSPLAEVASTAVKPKKALRSVRPEPVPGMRYIHKTTLQGSLSSAVSGPLTMLMEKIEPVRFLSQLCNLFSEICTDDQDTLYLQVLQP